MSFRKEEKLKIHKNKLYDLIDWINSNGGYILHEKRIVSSTYFDNDQFQMYHDSEEGSVPRKKIRIRSYTNESHTENNSLLEVKISSVEGRYKTVSKSSNLKKYLVIGVLDSDYGICRPVLRVSYRRIYYKVHKIRLTIDHDIRYRRVYNGKECSFLEKDPDVIVELKAGSNVSTKYLYQMFPFDRVRFSKYSRAVQMLRMNMHRSNI